LQEGWWRRLRGNAALSKLNYCNAQDQNNTGTVAVRSIVPFVCAALARISHQAA
jgi:hypothetical protein